MNQSSLEFFSYDGYYDPGTGRFLSEDPIGFKGKDPNFYNYTQNNPVLNSDPSGLQGMKVAVACLTMSASAVAAKLYMDHKKRTCPIKNAQLDKDDAEDKSADASMRTNKTIISRYDCSAIDKSWAWEGIPQKTLTVEQWNKEKGNDGK